MVTTTLLRPRRHYVYQHHSCSLVCQTLPCRMCCRLEVTVDEFPSEMRIRKNYLPSWRVLLALSAKAFPRVCISYIVFEDNFIVILLRAYDLGSTRNGNWWSFYTVTFKILLVDSVVLAKYYCKAIPNGFRSVETRICSQSFLRWQAQHCLLRYSN